MKFRPRVPARIAAGAAVALGAALVAAAPATAAPQAIVYPCQASTAFGPIETTFDQEVEATAPATVAPGGDLTVTVVTSPDQIPATVSGFPVTELKDFRLVFPIPANSTFVSAALSGGEGLGGEPVLTVEGTDVVVTLDSSIAGGADYTLPVLTLNLVAGESGTVDFALGGTGYEDPGLSLTAVVDVLGTPLEAPTACYPSPNPVLSSTAITAA